MAYLRRTVDTELDELFDDVPAIAIDGPKAVGKTTTAQHRAEGTLRLDDPATRSVTQADPSTILLRNRPLLVDEWQHVPAVWDVIRHSVDDDPHGGQFLLAGSATPYEQTRQHSGAGRIGRLRMRPMTLQERQLTEPTVSLADLLTGRRPALQGDSRFGLPEYVEEIVASGFPAIRTMRERARRFAIDSYLRNAVDKDVPEQGFAVRRPEAMMAWLRAYAAATSTTASYSQILDAATPGQAQKPARSTADSYRGVLASLWLLRLVPLRQRPQQVGKFPQTSSGRPGTGCESAWSGCVEPAQRGRHPAGSCFWNDARIPFRVTRHPVRAGACPGP